MIDLKKYNLPEDLVQDRSKWRNGIYEADSNIVGRRLWWGWWWWIIKSRGGLLSMDPWSDDLYPFCKMSISSERIWSDPVIVNSIMFTSFSVFFFDQSICFNNSAFIHRYLIASHTTDYQHPMLFLNTLAVIVLVIAKFPNMHKVRIFGINGDQWVDDSRGRKAWFSL